MKCENNSVCCNRKSNFFDPVPIVDGVTVPDSVIEGVFVPDSSGDDSEPESDILIGLYVMNPVTVFLINTFLY